MSLTPAIILIIVAAVAGYFLGIFDSRLTEAAKKKLAEVSAPAAEDEEKPKDQNLKGEHTVLKVTVDTALRWHLELDGTRIDDQAAMSAEQRQRLVNVVVQMRPWIDGKLAPAAPVPTSITPPESMRPVPEPNLPAPKLAQQFQVAAPPPRVDIVRGFRSMLKNEIASPDKIKSQSIVTMIDEVLQAKLLSSPLLSRGIRLEEGSLGEVIVFVGPHRYSGVDAVPEPEIQAIIKAAIADWEKK
jgi:hypothetical protein